jgi:TolB-like protein
VNRILTELRRRNVFRVAAAYLVLGWLVLQVVIAVEGAAGMPAWADSFALIILLAGFPVALVVAWAFELAPDGVGLTAPLSDVEPAATRPARWLDAAMVAALLAFTSMLLLDRILPPEPGLAVAADLAPAAVDDVIVPLLLDAAKSIAVLPFADFSSDGDQAWFADGLTEEILNSLARVPDLLVTSRTSSFAYRDTTEEIPQIAASLGVAHVLEGSVRRGGGRLRVTAQLIRASDGFHLWSENYDRTTDDAILIQEDIAIAIARALETAMDPEALARMADAGTHSIAAYEAYLEGNALRERGSAEGDENLIQEAAGAYERARALDPEFAEAHYAAANRYYLNMNPTVFGMSSATDSMDESLRLFLERVDAAIAVTRDPNRAAFYRAQRAEATGRLGEAARNLRTYAATYPLDAQGWSDLAKFEVYRGDYAAAREAANRLEALINNDAEYHAGTIFSYLWARGPGDTARVAHAAVAAFPDRYDVLYQAHRALLWTGDVEAASAIAARLFNSPDFPADHLALVELRQACAEGDTRMADQAMARLEDAEPGVRWLALVVRGRTADAQAVLAPFDRAAAPYPLQSWLYYPYFDPAPFPNFMALLDREGIDRREPEAMPFACAANAE